MLWALTARAAPWNQDEGHGILILQTTPYWANVQGYDATGRPAGRGSLNRVELGPYWEHGLTSNWTVGLAPRLQSIWLNDTQRTTTNTGIAEIAAFARYQVYRGTWDVFSVQGTFFTPGLDRLGHNPRVAEPNLSAELRALYGVSFPLGDSASGFASVEAGYRYRAGPASDELRLDATFGVRAFDRWLFMLQSFNTLGMRNANISRNGPDYSVAKLQFSAVYDLNQSYSLQLGYMREIDGRHVPLGSAIILGLWYRY